MWTFTREFLKRWTTTWKMWTLTRVFFFLKVDLILKNVDIYACFFLKSGPQPEKCGPLGVFSGKKWTLKYYFFEKVDLNQKNVDSYTWSFNDVDLILKSWQTCQTKISKNTKIYMEILRKTQRLTRRFWRKQRFFMTKIYHLVYPTYIQPPFI